VLFIATIKRIEMYADAILDALEDEERKDK